MVMNSWNDSGLAAQDAYTAFLEQICPALLRHENCRTNLGLYTAIHNRLLKLNVQVNNNRGHQIVTAPAELYPNQPIQTLHYLLTNGKQKELLSERTYHTDTLAVVNSTAIKQPKKDQIRQRVARKSKDLSATYSLKIGEEWTGSSNVYYMCIGEYDIPY